MYGNTYTTSGYTTNGNANPNRAGMMQQRYIQQTQPGGYPMTAQQRIYRTQPGATNPQMMSQQFKLNAYQMQYMQQQKADPMGFQTKKPNVTSGSFNAQPQEMHVLQMAQQMQAMQANRGVNMMQQPVYPYNRTAQQQPSMKPSYMQPQMAQMQRVTPPPPRKEEPEKREVANPPAERGALPHQPADLRRDDRQRDLPPCAVCGGGVRDEGVEGGSEGAW